MFTFGDGLHEAVAQKKTRADVEKMLRAEFHFGDLHITRSLDGLIAEMQ